MKKEYKLMIMGATGVGKTVFLASYFNAIANLEMGRYPIAVRDASSVEKVTTITKELFIDHEPPMGTAARINLGFDVNKLGMKVILHDLPGGYTTDMEQWVRQNILPDLQTASGVLFFISAEDLINNSKKLIQDNLVFSTAISCLRDGVDGEKPREDAPVWFMFTKGDTVPDVTLEDLTSRIPALLNAGKRDGDGASFFTKGKYVKCWKTTAIGKWPNPTTPPEQYEPENVVEPMEEMFLAMKRSGSEFKRKLSMLTIATITVGYIALIAAGYGFDYYRWQGAVSLVEKQVSVGQFEDALKSIEDFKSRWELPPWILPKFLRPRADADKLVSDTLTKYEKNSYESLRSDLEAVDMTKIPGGDFGLFSASAERIRVYLANTKFYEINPGNYEKVKQAHAYYAMGLALMGSEQGAPSELTPDEMYARIVEQLGIISQIPQEWWNQLLNKTDNLIREWSRTISSDADLLMIAAYIDKANTLIENPSMPAELKEFLVKKISQWEIRKGDWWSLHTKKWISEAAEKKPEEAIKILQSRQQEAGLPDNNRQNIDEALNIHFDRLVVLWLSEDLDEIALKDRLAKYPSMPIDKRGKIEQRIDELARDKVTEVVRAILKAGSMEELAGALESMKAILKQYPQSKGELSAKLEESMRSLVDKENTSIKREANALVSKEDFGSAVGKINKGFDDLRSKIISFSAEIDITDITQKLETSKNDLLAKTCDNEYKYCKGEFDSIRNSSDGAGVKRVIDKMQGFLSRWPLYDKVQEISRVKAFLEYIRGGAEANLIIVDGSFAWLADVFSQADIAIALYEDGNLVGETNVVDDNNSPHFGYSYKFTWTPSKKFTFAGYEDGSKEFEKIVSATGLFGYERLTAALRNNNCILNIKLEHNIPDCPWR